MATPQYPTREIRRFSWRWWFGAGRSVLWVGVITALVWIYADMEVTRDREVPMTIWLTTGNSPDLILLSSKQYKVVVTVRGAQAGLKRFVSRYANAVITFDVSPDHGAGEWAIPTLDILRQATDIVEMGVEARSASPAAITAVHLDRRVHKQVPVLLEYSNAVLDEAPKTTARISLGASQWEAIPEDQRVLRTVIVDLGDKPTGVATPVTAEIVRSMGGQDITLEPGQDPATFSVLIKQRTTTKSVKVTVRAIVPCHWLEEGTLGRYVLKRREEMDWRPTIVFTGPVTDLARLEPADVDAYVELKDDDLIPVSSWLPRQVQIRLPENLKVTAEDRPTVEFRFEEAPPAPPG